VVAVTYASHGGSDDRFCRAVESAVRHDIPWEILGWGVRWEGLSQKLQASLDYVRGLDPDCIILFSDAFDILFTQPLAAIKKSFERTNANLLFAGECGCWPQVIQDKAKGYRKGHICNTLYPKSPTPYKFLNSGAWMGYARAAEGLLAAVVKRANSEYGMKTNDQEMVSDMYIQHQFNISLDWHARIFQCMHSTHDAPLPYCDPSKDVKESKGVWKNTLTGTTPALFHFK
jgi:procollagen-lysine,2-oxoglutarate 5-dioxygenase